MPSVSHSEVDSYLLCRRKHYYGYGLSLERVSSSDSLAIGSAGHKVLEAFYKVILEAGSTPKQQQAAWDTGMSAALTKYHQLVKDGFKEPSETGNKEQLYNILFHPVWGYFAANEPYIGKDTILAVEKEFSLEYDPDTGAQYPFVVDLIIQRGKDFVIVDHKFCYDFYTMEASDLQPQIPKYVGALRGLGYKIGFGEYNMLRTRKIKGTKDKKTNTYPGPTPDQMQDVLVLKPNVDRVERTFVDQIGVAAEIQARKELPIEEQERTAWRVANKMVCQSCSFRDLCEAELTGSNTSLLLKVEYKTRERKKFLVSEDAAEES